MGKYRYGLFSGSLAQDFVRKVAKLQENLELRHCISSGSK
jgi:hypothetical protein